MPNKKTNFIYLPTDSEIKGDYSVNKFVTFIYPDKKTVQHKICLLILKQLINNKSVNQKDLFSKITSRFKGKQTRAQAKEVTKKLESIGLLRSVAAREHVKYLLTVHGFSQLLRTLINYWTRIYRKTD